MTREQFASLHTSSNPLVLFNVWDAGSARAVADAGAKAIATGSLALAGAQGHADGEAIAFADVLRCARQIRAVIECPLSVDIESGYAEAADELAANAQGLLEAGAIGCNLEDRLIGADTLRDMAQQAERIAVLDRAGLFVNARNDLFLALLMKREDPNRPDLIEPTLERASAYFEAGAKCFFVPGLSDPDLIAQLCARSPLPINVMRLPGMVDNAQLAALGVARISYGPGPWQAAMKGIEDAARAAFG